MMLFNKIDNFIEVHVYNNSVIELASSVIKFRPKYSAPKHCIRSITYNYATSHYPLTRQQWIPLNYQII